MLTNLKYFALVGLACLAVGYVFGRFETPDVKTAETTQMNTDKQKDVVTQTTTTVQEQPNGAKTTQTVTTSHTVASVATSEQSKEKTSSTTGGGHTNFDLLYGYQIGRAGPVYGGAITKDVLGPISLGVWGLTNSTYGVSLGVSF